MAWVNKAVTRKTRRRLTAADGDNQPPSQEGNKNPGAEGPTSGARQKGGGKMSRAAGGGRGTSPTTNRGSEVGSRDSDCRASVAPQRVTLVKRGNEQGNLAFARERKGKAQRLVVGLDSGPPEGGLEARPDATTMPIGGLRRGRSPLL